jgi:RNA recognition motif-containing protein
MKKLFVGSLPYSTTSTDVEEMFTKIGTVSSVNLITDRNTGQSKGFAFVEMESDDEAQKAIEQLNGTDVGGRNIIVNEARPQEKREFNPKRSW